MSKPKVAALGSHWSNCHCVWISL